METPPFPTEIELSEVELTTLINALNEVCNGPEALDDHDFQGRIGCERPEALLLIMRLLAKKQHPQS